MKEKFKQLYMKFAFDVAKNSHCERLKVGCVIVNDHNLVYGYNGTPENWDNCCEDENYQTSEDVLHAEENAIAKIASSPITSVGSSVFITHSPCLRCAKLLARLKVKEVFYSHEYRCDRGLLHLKKCGIKVERYELG